MSWVNLIKGFNVMVVCDLKQLKSKMDELKILKLTQLVASSWLHLNF